MAHHQVSRAYDPNETSSAKKKNSASHHFEEGMVQRKLTLNETACGPSARSGLNS